MATAHTDNSLKDWRNFTPPTQLPLSHPWLARFYPSAILQHAAGPAGSGTISTIAREVYSIPKGTEVATETTPNESPPVAFRIGNGGAGYTGILQVLAEQFLQNQRQDSGDSLDPIGGIAWVVNHSRHSQAALLGDVVQVALTYESIDDDVAVEGEGWARRVGVAFWDHFILVGPREDPAGLAALLTDDGGEMMCREAFRRIARSRARFHTRGDGSATFERERALWAAAAAGVQVSGDEEADWRHTHALAPYPALQLADEQGAYLLTDRATFLTAKHDATIPRLRVFVEGGEELLNPCSALVNVLVDTPASRAATAFAEWLVLDAEAQRTINEYGRSWPAEMPLFTVGAQREFDGGEGLRGRNFAQGVV